MAHRSREKPSHHRLDKGREKVERKKKGIHNEKDGKGERTPAAIILSFWRAQRKKGDEYGRSSSHSRTIFSFYHCLPSGFL